MKEFFHVVSLDEARRRAGGFASVGVERVALEDGLGRALAADLVAAADLPGFRRSTVDGYAVAAASTFGASGSAPALLEVVGSVEMGSRPDLTVGPGRAAAILTGGMLPDGADAVVMVEHTERIDERMIEVVRTVAPGGNVIEPADDAREGDVLIRAGARLRAQELGLLAALGVGEVEVRRRPVVAILSTGDEVVPVGAEPGPGQVRDVNSETLSALVTRAGGVPDRRGIVPDDFDALLAASREALADADVVLLSGGSSVGTRDLTIDVLEALPDSRVLLHGVAMKPGKPTILADVGGKAFWGLPGHVASAMVVFTVLVRDQLEAIGGARAVPEPEFPAVLTRNVSSAHGRREFLRVKLEERQGRLHAVPVLGKSGLIRPMVEADGLVSIDRDTEGLDEGTEVRVRRM